MAYNPNLSAWKFRFKQHTTCFGSQGILRIKYHMRTLEYTGVCFAVIIWCTWESCAYFNPLQSRASIFWMMNVSCIEGLIDPFIKIWIDSYISFERFVWHRFSKPFSTNVLLFKECKYDSSRNLTFLV
jgi:hypothetical protein